MSDIRGLIWSFNKILYDWVEQPFGYHINYLSSNDTETIGQEEIWVSVNLLELGNPIELGEFVIQLNCYSTIKSDPTKYHLLTLTDRILMNLGFSSRKTFPRYTFNESGDILGTNGELYLVYQSMNSFDQTADGLHNQIIIEYLVIASNICIEDNINNMKMTQVIGENKFG